MVSEIKPLRQTTPSLKIVTVEKVLDAMNLLSEALQLNRNNANGSNRAAISLASAITLANDAIGSLVNAPNLGRLQ